MQTTKEKNFDAYLAANLNDYTGEWVIFCEGKLIAHDENLKNAVDKAQAIVGQKRLMIAKVPEKETMIYLHDDNFQIQGN